MQDNEPLAFHTRKMNAAQAKHSMGEQELLSMVETLKMFEGTLQGQNSVAHVDQLNLSHKKLASDQLTW